MHCVATHQKTQQGLKRSDISVIGTVQSRNASENPAGIETDITYLENKLLEGRNASENPAGIETSIS